MKTFFMLFTLLLTVSAQPAFAASESTVIEVINVDVGADTEKLIAALTPKDFKDVQVIRHSYGHGQGNYETRGILIDSNEERWDGYWDDNQGYSIKTTINGVVAQEGKIVIGSIEYVPFGFSTMEEAMSKAKQIVDTPIFIDLSQQEKARTDKEEAAEIASVHEQSIYAEEQFDGASGGSGGSGSGL